MSKLDGYKKGDEVEVCFRGVVETTEGGDLSVQVGRGFSVRFWSYEVEKDTFQIIRIEPAFKVGDEVLVLGRQRNSNETVVGFLKDGRAIVEYQAGDSSNVCAYDISCLTRA